MISKFAKTLRSLNIPEISTSWMSSSNKGTTTRNSTWVLQSWQWSRPTDVRQFCNLTVIFQMKKAYMLAHDGLLTARSEDSKVKGHIAWQATNFALKVAASAIKWVKERIVNKNCPCDPFCVTTNVCGFAKNFLSTVFAIIVMVLEKVRNNECHNFRTKKTST